MDRKKAPAPLELRGEMLTRVADSELDAARKALLFDVVETYFRLSPSESERYRQLVLRTEIQMGDTELSPLTWAGEIELKAKQDMLLKQLTKKFGPLPDGTVEKLQAIELEDLDAFIERVITATSLDEMLLG